MSSQPEHAERLRITLRGAVQGVGFRPFVYRLATELGLRGWVSNTSQGVFVEVEGTRSRLQQFAERVVHGRPPRSMVQSIEQAYLPPVGFTEFSIRESDTGGEKSVLVLPDIASCPECIAEVFDPANRRYLYPFTNCTHCGPRFSIVEAVPYDRSNTSMRHFRMCPACEKEYHDPVDRRFHAQPNACPVCGPHVELWDPGGRLLARDYSAMEITVEVIRRGGIVAVKGIGGFHLMVEAASEQAVTRLRKAKHREEKPLAVMYPSIKEVVRQCDVSEVEGRLLVSAEAPIVLLRKKPQCTVAPSVAPGNPHLGVMLPYSPLHHMLMRALGVPVVATSGNVTDEPMCTDEYDALHRLGPIADVLLVHDRPIVRHVDDSVVRVVAGQEQVLRRGRGYAPLPVPAAAGKTVLALGAHLKNTVALACGPSVFISQHIGDLESREAEAAFKRSVSDLPLLYETTPDIIAADMHPDYVSSRYAHGLGGDRVEVQHHHAHVASCIAEHNLDGDVLGISWDGTGYGLDGTIWGGEFLLVNRGGATRVATLRQFPLPGGDAAAREPRRAAVGLLHALADDPGVASLRNRFSETEYRLILQMLVKHINSPLTSSVGRLFDAVASLMGLRDKVRFEGQAAMELEFAIAGAETDASYAFAVDPGRKEGVTILDWAPTIKELWADVMKQRGRDIIAARFHNTLAEMMMAVAKLVRVDNVVLTGGCFQNAYLTERAVRRLQQEGFRPYWHQRVPPNDGGIALGQALVARWLSGGALDHDVQTQQERYTMEELVR